MRQAEVLRDLGAVPVVVAVADADHAQDRWRLDGAEVVTVPGAGPRALAYAPALGQALAKARLDLLHLHGVWQYPTHAAGAWARGSGRPLVISPHGMFDPWIVGRNRWKKDLAALAWEKRGWHSAAHFHALTADEAHDVGTMVSPAAPASVIPNPAPDVAAAPRSARPPVALYIGRIHEKKNLAALVEGWHRALPALPEGAMLTIAGWGDDEGIAALEASMRAAPPMAGETVEFVGTAFGSQKAALFDIARFCILPSHSEGLPMTILEAWAAGTPTIMSPACHLPEGFAAGAAIECGTSSEEIARSLVTAFALGEEQWAAMSHAARGLAGSRFSAGRIGAEWERLYAALIDGRS